MPYLQIPRGPRLFYTDAGSGRPVLFIHGMTCDGSDWSWLASGLGPDHRTVVVDSRGHGRSSHVDGAYDIDDLTSDYVGLIRHLGLGRPVVVAHSFGALPAVRLAADYAGLLSALVLIDPAYGRADADAGDVADRVAASPHAAMLQVFAGFHVAATPAWLRWWHRRRVLGTREDVIRDTVHGAYSGPRPLGRRSVAAVELARVTAPRLVVYSGANADRYRWDLALPHPPDDRLELWPDNGHFLHQEAPQRFEGCFRTWLAAQRRDSDGHALRR